MERIASLIVLKLKTMAEAEDFHPLRSKRKAITTLLPYAVWQERNGKPEMLDTILRAARASRMLRFMWYHATQFVGTLLFKASPRAVALVSPHIAWGWLTDKGDLIQQWAKMASEVPYTEEVAQGVIDTLLQIISHPQLVPYIPVSIWSWLIKRPSLPPVCKGRYLGTDGPVVKVVQALKDVEVLKSYLLLVWSEWDSPGGFNEMCVSIQVDFGRTGMGNHRADLVRHLDHVLGQLDRGLEYLKRHDPEFDEDALWRRKDRYRKLRETLVEMDTKAISCTPQFNDCALPYADSHPGCTQDPAQRMHPHSHVHCLMVGTSGASTLYFVRTLGLCFDIVPSIRYVP